MLQIVSRKIFFQFSNFTHLPKKLEKCKINKNLSKLSHTSPYQFLNDSFLLRFWAYLIDLVGVFVLFFFYFWKLFLWNGYKPNFCVRMCVVFGFWIGTKRLVYRFSTSEYFLQVSKPNTHTDFSVKSVYRSRKVQLILDDSIWKIEVDFNHY